MKERPILFSGPMVRAIIEGRKTQTRRVVKPAPLALRQGIDGWRWKGEHHDFLVDTCPYGKPGDRLWVKETCRAYERPENCNDGVLYVADGAFRLIENTEDAADAWIKLYAIYGKRGATCPSIFMPRWASRITLEITGVRVERLNDVSEEDARAEGLQPLYTEGPEPACWGITERGYGFGTPGNWNFTETPVAAFRRLWDAINGAGSWWANPWVWVIEFKADRLVEDSK